MENEELYDRLKEVFHDALEETIINIREDNKKEFNVVNDKLDELNSNIRELIKILSELL